MKGLIKKILSEIVAYGGSVLCDNCGWTWEISDAGDDKYTCHKCGHDNTPKKSNFARLLDHFKNTLIILTSNLGVKKLQDFGTGIGFSNNTYANEEAKKQVLMKEMKNFFSPEFLNRIDDTIVFNSLTPEDIKKITDIELKKLVNRLSDIKYKIVYDDTLVEYLAKVGYDEMYGARPLKRAIQDKVEDLLSEEVLTGKMVEGKTYNIKVDNDEIKISKKGK